MLLGIARKSSTETCYKIGMTVDPPFINDCIFAENPSKECLEFPGITVESLAAVAAKNQICLEPFQSFHYGGDFSSNDSSVFGNLLNGKIDLTEPLSATEARQSLIPFMSLPVDYDQGGFVYRR